MILTTARALAKAIESNKNFKAIRENTALQKRLDADMPEAIEYCFIFDMDGAEESMLYFYETFFSDCMDKDVFQENLRLEIYLDELHEKFDQACERNWTALQEIQAEIWQLESEIRESK